MRGYLPIKNQKWHRPSPLKIHNSSKAIWCDSVTEYRIVNGEVRSEDSETAVVLELREAQPNGTRTRKVKS